ncbi:fasciclin domain-containing protein [Rufibacter sp. XAAS-G3-1]|uniref:fasciclin domain-containing protein n=1 Tax=Rufibacter sp. XAAS-G3-1 TaxID=2729134 RepID=UPI0015E66087|nr:fasciclin domain-containing protein [Rufibacter sp. XAAS-G3-1]
MIKSVKVLLYFLSLLVLLTNCDDKDEYYARPETLEPPIYQQLEAKGNFKSFLALVDKADYKNILSAAGYWTLFAPNDEAFTKYFAANGIAGVDAVSKETAIKIVTYALVYNAFMTDRLDDYQDNIGWVPDQAFKRRTAYYKGIYTGPAKVGNQVLQNQNIISGNRSGGYVFADNNNKYIPYFMQIFFANQRLAGTDYTFFYPGVNWNQNFHVANAKVVTPNIIAENGVIHEVDNVILPLENIEEYIASKPEYSVFRELFEKYMVYYQQSPEATERNRILTGSTDPVYAKIYDGQLEFALNDEGFEVRGASRLNNEGQSNTYTIYAPKNDVVTNYINRVILQHYNSLDEAPVEIIRDFLNAHMFTTAVWPSKFAQAPLKTSEEARINPNSNVVDARILSNGFFYGTNKVQEANVFHTVYGKAYLDPKYSMMIRALAGYKESLTTPNVRYTLFLISDAALTAAGFSWDTRFNYWVYTPPTGGTVVNGPQAQVRLQRIIDQHIVTAADNRNTVFNDLSGEGILQTFSEEYIRFNNKKVFAAGNVDKGEQVSLTGPVQTSNGVVYYVDRILNFSELKPSQHLAANPNFSHFYNYLRNSPLMYDAATLDVKGTTVGTPYTYLIPTNAAIQQAVKDGILPGTTAGVPNFNPATPEQRDQVARFLQYHIIAKEQVPFENQAEEPRGYETIFQNVSGNIGILGVSYSNGQMVITDANNRKATVVKANSNVLSNRAIIHQIDNYLLYREN